MTFQQQRRTSRISLSDMDQLARSGQVQLTANEVQLFHRKGILKSISLPTPPLSTINEAVKSPTTVQAVSTSATPILLTNTSTLPAASASNVLKSLSGTTSSTPSSVSSSSGSLPSPRMSDQDDIDVRKKRRLLVPGVFAPQKQTVRPFHFNTFENTTSHLFPENAFSSSTPTTTTGESSIASWRRHSTADALDTTTSLAPTQAVDFPAARRSSTSVIPSVVRTPLGQQTVLYAAASPAHTLYSLPYKSSSDTPAHGGAALPPQPPQCPPSPISPIRKRKSVPHRSPSANDPNDLSPGVVFQLPFGHWSPSLTAKASRETSLSSSYSSLSSSSEITVRPPSPPLPVPSPNSSSAATIVMESSSSATSQPTPSSHNAHVADASITTTAVVSTISTATTTTTTTITDQVHGTSNSICSSNSSNSNNSEVASTCASANASSAEPSGLGIRVDHMPLTPPTTTCPETAPLETTPTPVGGTPAPSSSHSLSAPWTPVTPSNGFMTSTGPSQTSENGEPTIHAGAATTHDAPRSRDSASPAAAEDPSQLPLKAQRQLSIRRQSLIPRPELDFVNGSGILPPASQNLDTRGGAHILSYPVLLSDMVQVAMDDAHARGESYGHSDEMESDGVAGTNHSSQSKAAQKRKRGGNQGKKRGSFSGPSQAHGDNDENGSPEVAQSFTHKRRRSSQTTLQANGTPTTRSKDLALGSPVTLAQSNAGGRASGTRGNGKPGRPRKPKTIAGQRSLYGHGDQSYDEDERSDPSYEAPSSFKPQPNAIPPEEIDVAIRHTREMMMHMEGKASHGGQNYHPSTLQPLLNATRHRQQQQQHDESGCYDDHYLMAGGNSQYAHPVDEDETEDEHRPVRSNRGQSHRTYPGESDYDVEEEVDDDDDDEDDDEDDDHNEGAASLRVAEKSRAREVTPRPKLDKGKSKAQLPKEYIKPCINPKTAENAESSTHKRKRPNNEGNEPECSNWATKRRRPSSTAVSGFSSAAYAQLQKAKMEARMSGKGDDGPPSSARDGGGDANSRPSRPDNRKKCLACSIQDTPCWRPSYKEGTSLCNSCGLRFKKVGVICLSGDCNYIPIKSEYAEMESRRKRLEMEYLMCFKCLKPVHQPAKKPNSNNGNGNGNGNGSSNGNNKKNNNNNNDNSGAPGPSSSSSSSSSSGSSSTGAPF